MGAEVATASAQALTFAARRGEAAAGGKVGAEETRGTRPCPFVKTNATTETARKTGGRQTSAN